MKEMNRFLMNFLLIHLFVLLKIRCELLNTNTTISKSIYSPSKLSDCSCKLDDGKIIDLKTLDNPSNPR